MICFKKSVKKIYICLSIFAMMPGSALAQKSLPTVRLLKPLPQPQAAIDNFLERLKDQGPRSDDKMILDLEPILGEKKEVMGPRTGGGGNSCSLAIVQNVTRLTGMLSSIKGELLAEDDVDRLRDIIKKAKFYVADRLVLNGQVKDAINYPREGVVVLSKNFCDTEMIEPSGRSMSLLLHEFLGLAGIDDRQYQISRHFLTRYAELVSEEFRLRNFLKTEAAKDLNGSSSCFKGHLKRKDAEMFENYGGRYSPGEIPEFNLMLVEEENYRQLDKYCDVYLDKNKKPVKNREEAAFEMCHAWFESSYVASAGFGFSTTGSSGQETVLTLVKISERIESLIDIKAADYESSIVSSKQTQKNTKCQNIKLPK